jgi:hypothetical protein
MTSVNSVENVKSSENKALIFCVCVAIMALALFNCVVNVSISDASCCRISYPPRE